MISVQEATEIVNNHLGNFGEEKVSLSKCVNRVLTEDISADRDFPPFNRVMMDGIAINFKAWKQGSKSFKIEGVQYAGIPVKKLDNLNNCMEVMTGAMLPVNTDTVIRYEDFSVDNGIATIEISDVKQGQHVHDRGIDKKVGELLIKKGVLISPAEVAILATVGRLEVMVKRMPTVAVISSGDELVEVNASPQDHQIRKSNVYALQASLSELDVETELHHIVDEPSSMKLKIKALIDTNDVLILRSQVTKLLCVAPVDLGIDQPHVLRSRVHEEVNLYVCLQQSLR